MSIEDIEKVYSLYKIGALSINCEDTFTVIEEPLFPQRIKPPSAFLISDQIISDISIPKK